MKQLRELIEENNDQISFSEAKKEPFEIAYENFWKLFNLYIKEIDSRFKEVKKGEPQLQYIEKKAKELSSYINEGIEFLVDVNEGGFYDLSNRSDYNKAANELKSLK